MRHLLSVRLINECRGTEIGSVLRALTKRNEENMTDYLSVSGVVATEPRSVLTAEGLAICTFRLASPQRHFKKSENQWTDGETNWYTVSTFRQLAEHASTSLKKGERVVARGRLKLRHWERDEKTGVSAELEAESLGHDLRWGTTVFSRADATDRLEPEELLEFSAKRSEHADADSEKVPF